MESLLQVFHHVDAPLVCLYRLLKNRLHGGGVDGVELARAIDKAVKGTPFSVDILCGITCQETAYFWLPLLKRLSANEILARCVLDANGDYPGTKRSAFPTNTAAFRNQCGDEFADMLISEANKTRKLRGFGPQQWVYKGYGLFQGPILQSVKTDEAFFASGSGTGSTNA